MVDAHDAVELHKQITRLRAQRQSAVNQHYERVTGRTMPESFSFRDEAGDLYEFQVHVTLRLVSRATGEES